MLRLWPGRVGGRCRDSAAGKGLFDVGDGQLRGLARSLAVVFFVLVLRQHVIKRVAELARGRAVQADEQAQIHLAPFALEGLGDFFDNFTDSGHNFSTVTTVPPSGRTRAWTRNNCFGWNAR